MSELVYYINYMRTYQMRINVSVVIPVYNVEPYIKRCVESLMSQTLKTGIEFIFVNDCSTDNSVNLIEEVVSCYSERKDQVRIIHHSSNKGLACTRLTGIKEAKGDYIIQCDSDDWVEKDMYETLINKATETDADIVVCAFFHEFLHSQKIESFEEKTPHEAILSKGGNYWWSTCNRLVKKSLYFDNDVFPIPDINMMEDVCVMMRLYYFAKRIEYVHQPLYHYDRTREGSLMHKACSTKSLLERKKCVDFLNAFFESNHFDFTEIYNLYKSNIRDSFLLQNPPNWKEWRQCYPETWKTVWANKSLSLMYRLCYTLASWGILTPFKLYTRKAKYR